MNKRTIQDPFAKQSGQDIFYYFVEHKQVDSDTSRAKLRLELRTATKEFVKTDTAHLTFLRYTGRTLKDRATPVFRNA